MDEKNTTWKNFVIQKILDYRTISYPKKSAKKGIFWSIAKRILKPSLLIEKCSSSRNPDCFGYA
jgi:hypothetical protein